MALAERGGDGTRMLGVPFVCTTSGCGAGTLRRMGRCSLATDDRRRDRDDTIELADDVGCDDHGVLSGSELSSHDEHTESAGEAGRGGAGAGMWW